MTEGTVIDMADFIARLHNRFIYDRVTGRLLYRRGPKFGKEAGSTMRNGYKRVGFEGKEYLVHRLIWLIEKGVWPGPHLDHKNHDTKYNQIDNLQDRGVVGNAMNRVGANSNNSSGARGVEVLPSGNFRVRISSQHFGTFPTLESATQAAEAFRERYISNRN